MPRTVWIIEFNLKKGVTEDQFLKSSKRVCQEIISKQKGYISWDQFLKDDTWIDFVVWETMEDAKKALTAGSKNPVAREFYSLMVYKSIKTKILTVKGSYGLDT